MSLLDLRSHDDAIGKATLERLGALFCSIRSLSMHRLREDSLICISLASSPSLGKSVLKRNQVISYETFGGAQQTM